MRVLTSTPATTRVSRQVRLKSAKNLYLRHRFFDEIRQIHSFFYVFRQKLQILLRNQAREDRLRRAKFCEPENYIKSE